jgi:hypothetical protein
MASAFVVVTGIAKEGSYFLGKIRYDKKTIFHLLIEQGRHWLTLKYPLLINPAHNNDFTRIAI